MKRIPLLLAALSLLGCGEQSRQHQANGSDTLSYSYQDIREVSSLRMNKTDSTYITLHYPLFEGRMADNMNAWVINSLNIDPEGGTVYKSAEQLAKAFISGYDEYAKTDPEYLNSWSAIVSVEVTQNTPSIISLSSDSYAYTGGAHGMGAILYSNYDVTAQKLLKLDDLLQPGYQAPLLQAGERIFRKNEGLKPDETLEGKYFFEGDTFSLCDNFLITPTSLKFLYNPYEIKPYSEGMTVLDIPYTEISALIPKNSLLHTYLKK